MTENTPKPVDISAVDIPFDDIDSEDEMFSSLLDSDYATSDNETDDSQNRGDTASQMQFVALYENFQNSLVSLRKGYTAKRAALENRKAEIEEKLYEIHLRLKKNEGHIKTLEQLKEVQVKSS